MSVEVADPDLTSRVRRGLAWSTASNLLLRVGSLSVGICLARLLAPEQFGVYAVALMVQSVLMTLADLGLSADLIRSEDPERKAPTVASLSVVAGATLTALMVATAPWLADLLGSPESARPVQVLSFTLLLAGLGVVPYATLMRAFDQKRLFAVYLVDFIIGTSVTLLLVLAGWGAMGLAVGRLVAAALALCVQFRLARVRWRPGFDPEIAVAVLRYGIPVALANLLSWALLSVDTVVVARSLDVVQLGFYVLAFNISTWPMTALGQVVRSVALPGFARIPAGTGADRDGSLARSLGLVWPVALLAGSALALLATPLVGFVYGDRWRAAAPVLLALGVFGAMRVVFDLFASYLLARGAARATLMVQVAWLTALIPAVLVGVTVDGLRGVGWAHVTVALLVVMPAYAVAAHKAGADMIAVTANVWPPVLAILPAILAGWAAQAVPEPDWARLLLGSLALVVVYGALVQRWVLTRLPRSPRTHRTAATTSRTVRSI